MNIFPRMRVGAVNKPPGTLTYVGRERSADVTIDIIDYDNSRFVEERAEKTRSYVDYRDSDTVSWININGVSDTKLVGGIGSAYGVHPLHLEDILNTTLRPKCEERESYILVILKMLSYDEEAESVAVEQVSLVVGRGYVLSFQEREGDVFEEIRKRIRKNLGRVRSAGSDYLAYALVDAVVDNYFSVLDRISEKIEDTEEIITGPPSASMSSRIHLLRRELIMLRRSLWPLREIVNTLLRSESALLKKDTNIYLRDVYDHTVEIIDVLETFREQVHSLRDSYLSSVSNSMNAVMKVLTIIATIFIPLTFLAGIYGMNFRYMPELEWRLGYPVVLAAMAAIGILMFIFFKRKRWL